MAASHALQRTLALSPSHCPHWPEAHAPLANGGSVRAGGQATWHSAWDALLGGGAQ